MIGSAMWRSRSSSYATDLRMRGTYVPDSESIFGVTVCIIMLCLIVRLDSCCHCIHANRQNSVDEDEIEAQTDALRKKLLAESESTKGMVKKGLKMHQVHELAEAKIKQDNRFRNALGIRKDYEEGGHWKKQEERLRASLVEKSSDHEK